MIKLYLDTSVISALFDSRNPERQSMTKFFFNEMKIFISVITFAEVERTPDLCYFLPVPLPCPASDNSMDGL
jgi:hypothetical protein